MALLEPGATDATQTNPEAVVPPASEPATQAQQPADALDGAEKVLFGQNPEGQPKNEPAPEGETPEQKAEREARETETPEQKAEREAKEREGETPEQKAEREQKELDAKRYGAPEGDYEAFTLPDGVELDADGAKELAAVAKELNLSQASAQKLVDIAAAKAKRDGEAATANLDAVHDSWVEAAKTDKEFGGDKLNASLATAQKALKEFGSPELNELVVGARLGDHPEFIRLMTRVGTRLSEAPIVNGGKPVSGTAESVLYPNLKQ